MSIITQLVTATAIATFSPTVLTDTVTCYIATTLPASAGQTVTINLPPVVPPPMPTTKYTPSPPTAATVTAVVTATMIDVFLQDLKSVIYSTWVVSLNPTAIPAASGTPAPLVYVVEPQNDGGWDTWSTDARVGLIKVKLVVCTPLALESTHGYTEHGSRDVNCATDNGKRANSALQ
ncbi:uncharacterized protein PV06_03167 [Exophiala oligosperma]|uniref:Uncharacterized protein n=1 Tax=Exophiala oligosperma TaxID=215243 RepID=A0A0D2DQC9_9EURO|nr:uncharacterized protein PV06_03167 [Exophiala oligosperma]KIW44715.1 hypothetical protein PV06_03167 [Exophiala oligosperma]